MGRISYDLHCHTVMSNDAVNTLYELVREAQLKKVKLIAITDHGPGMIDGPHPTYFTISPRIPPVINDVVVLSGCEANILDLNGQIDLDDKLAKMQDIVIAGIHDLTPYPKGTSKSENTETIIATMKNPHIDVICHPYRKDFPTNVSALVDAAIEKGVLLELNVSLLKGNNISLDVLNSIKEMVRLCEEHSYPIALGSDTHIAPELGDFTPLNQLKIKLNTLDVFSLNTRRYIRLHSKILQNKKSYLEYIDEVR